MISSCLDLIGPNRYRCRNKGIEFTATKLPIRCCPEWTPDQPSRGLGDTIAKMTHAVGIKPCGGCGRRQKWLNEHIPYA